MALALVKGKPQDQVYTVPVEVDGVVEKVTVHPTKGPLERHPDGSTSMFIHYPNSQFNAHGGGGSAKAPMFWDVMTVTQQEVVLHQVAKKNMRLREWEQANGGKVDPQTPPFLVGIVAELKRRQAESAWMSGEQGGYADQGWGGWSS
uniref:Uncharacterized protein n=1 Tax=Alexandrium andersonii TaxID=327968 RepID=A0A7S2N1B1_9DINO